jgi:hypothetical protein
MSQAQGDQLEIRSRASTETRLHRSERQPGPLDQAPATGSPRIGKAPRGCPCASKILSVVVTAPQENVLAMEGEPCEGM